VRRRKPLSRPTLRRRTPISTTALPFVVHLDVNGGIGVQIVGYQRPLGEEARCGYQT
jgi:hypothetical protein